MTDTPKPLGFSTEWEATPLAPTVEDDVTDLKPCPNPTDALSRMTDTKPKGKLSIIGGMEIDGVNRVGVFIACDVPALRGLAPLLGDDVRVVQEAPTLADALAVPEVAAIVALVRAIAATEWQQTEPASTWIPDGCEAYVAEMEQHCNWSVEQARAALAAMEGRK